MSRYRFETVLAVALAVGCAAVWRWQLPADRMRASFVGLTEHARSEPA